MELIERHLSDKSSLRYTFLTGTFPSHPLRSFLIVRFEGESGVDSGNNGDAVFMAAIVAAGLKAWEPLGLILDLRGLGYVGGDMMTLPFSVHPDFSIRGETIPFPVTAVVSDRNRDGLTSLIRDEMCFDPKKMLFETLEDAVAEIERQSNRLYGF